MEHSSNVGISEGKTLCFTSAKNVTQKKPYVIIIDGIIGCGKFTLIDKCLVPQLTKRGYRVKAVYERSDLWELTGRLQEFYANKKACAYRFQTKVFVDRVTEFNKVYNQFKDEIDIFICERSIFTDRLFVEMLYKAKTIIDTEYQDYYDWFRLWRHVMPIVPTMFIYYKGSMDRVMKQVRERLRDGETAVDVTYQQLLENEHEIMFANNSVLIETDDHGGIKRVPVMRLETDLNFRDNESAQISVASEVESFFLKNVLEK